jgi:aspartyl protease family protein
MQAYSIDSAATRAAAGRRGPFHVRRLFWLLLFGLLIALLAFVARHQAGTIGELTSRDFASLVVKIAILVFVGGTVLTLFRERFTHAIAMAFFWVVVALILVLGYTYRFELRDVGERVLAELVPGYAASRGRNVEIARGQTGNFAIAARVNGARVPMVLDTGASAVVLTHEAAKAAGLPLEMVNYSVSVDTANGRTRAAPVTLDRVAVGGLVERSVTALIAQPGQLKVSLLGMSFLNRLESWEVRGDKLVMRGFP